MRIVFVIGPAFSGKSIYIRKEFPHSHKVNISTYNKIVDVAEDNVELETLAKNAQYYCREELQNRIRYAKEDDIIILEHQLLKKEGRAFFIRAVRELTDTPIECVVMAPSDEMVAKMLNFEKTLINFHAYEKGKLEMPEEDEGFASIKVIQPIFKEEDFKR